MTSKIHPSPIAPDAATRGGLGTPVDGSTCCFEDFHVRPTTIPPKPYGNGSNGVSKWEADHHGTCHKRRSS